MKRNRDEVRAFIDRKYKTGSNRDELLVAIMEEYEVSLNTAGIYLREYNLLKNVREKREIIAQNTKLEG